MRIRTRDDRGAVLVLTALSLGFIIAAVAFTIDLGRQIERRRDMQAIADVVSLDMVRNLNGRTVNQINADSANWLLEQQRSAARNNFTASKLTVSLGHVTTSNGVETFVVDTGDAVPTAVRVVASDHVDFFFSPGGGDVSRTAVAATDATVDYQLGSFLAGVTPSNTQIDLLNKVLKRALGTGTLSLDAVSYQGLAAGRVSLRGLATQMGFASPDQLANATVNAKQFYLATAQAMNANGGPAAGVTALNTIAATMNNSATMNVGDVIQAGSGSQDAFDTTFSVLGLITGSAFLINGNSAISVPSLDMVIPGIGAVDVSLTVIQKPMFVTKARVGDSSTTSQVSMSITIPINSFDVSSTPGIGALLPAASLEKLSGSITIVPTAGSATGSPTVINCGTSIAPSKSVDLKVTPTPVSLTASENLTLSATLPLLGNISLLNTNVTNATASATGTSDTGHFNYTADFMPSIGTGSPQRLGASSLNLAGALSASSANSTVAGVSVPFTKATLVNATNAALTNLIFPKIQDSIVPIITQTLGLDLGGGDIGANEMHCGGTKLES